MLQTYLFPAIFAAFKVGCRIEVFLQCFLGPPIWDPTYLALQSEMMLQLDPPLVRFDSDSYPSGWITTHQNAWPMPLISLKTCISTTTKDK
jgi:hypothetical protein